MEAGSGVTRSILHELHSWDMQRDQMEGESGVLEVSLMNFIVRISNEIKWNVKVVLRVVSLMNFILRITNKIEWKVKVVLPEVSLLKFIFRI